MGLVDVTRFDVCLPLILANEGGYTDNLADTGGPTNLGITQDTLSDWLKHPASTADVKALNPSKVAPIYKAKYWDACHCSQLAPGVDYMTFDLAVNSGVNRAVRYLQGAVGCAEDGVIGPKTLAALNHHSALDIVNAIGARREAFYRGLSNFAIFGRGWLNRLTTVTAQAQKWAEEWDK